MRAVSQEQPSQKFVRITGERGGMIEFEYAVGDMDMVLELLLPPAAFQDFCDANGVVVVSSEADEARTAAPQNDAERAMLWRPSDVQRQL